MLLSVSVVKIWHAFMRKNNTE